MIERARQVRQGGRLTWDDTYYVADVPVDVSGYTARLQVASKFAAQDPTGASVLTTLTKGAGITLTSAGRVLVVVPAATTLGWPVGRLFYDLRMAPPDGSTDLWYGGTITVLPSVTRG